MRRIRPSEHRPQRWKNGGGVTTEILKEPLDGDAFLYRVSIADVASDGPFSVFEGYDRHIMVLSGNGMHLDCGSHGAIVLTRNEPRFFSGDWAVTGTLIDGPVRDFNLMVDRARMKSSLEVVSTAGLVYADVCILHILAGPDAGDTLVAEGSLEIPRGITAASARLFRS
jgi:environmental stress-induced protein Ves